MTITRRAFMSLAPMAAWMAAESLLDRQLPRWAHLLGDEARAAPASRSLVREYPPSAISPTVPVRNLSLPADYARRLEGWTLRLGGLVQHPEVFGLEAFKTAFPKVTSINRLVCIEGWSAI
ncbi:MAG TPA: hypothetical protein V6D05_13640, partial [Stenomitos sp.]